MCGEKVRNFQEAMALCFGFFLVLVGLLSAGVLPDREGINGLFTFADRVAEFLPGHEGVDRFGLQHDDLVTIVINGFKFAASGFDLTCAQKILLAIANNLFGSYRGVLPCCCGVSIAYL